MREWSMGEAIGAGFRLIRREPVAFLAWSAVFGVLGLAPQALGLTTSLNTFAALGAGQKPDPQAVAQAMGPLQALQPLLFLTSIANYIILAGAVFRAILRPEDRGLLYLRFDARELWLTLTMLAIGVLYVGAILAMIIPMALIIGVAAFAGSSGGNAAPALGAMLIGFLIFLVSFAVIIWGAIRLSLALPMSFAEKTFRLPEAWRLTKGHALRMLGVMAVLVIIILAVELLLVGLAAGMALLVTPLDDLTRLMRESPGALFSRINPAVWAVLAVVWSLFGAGGTTVSWAAVATIYRDLRGPDTAEVFS